jgi:hypothetical protein
MKVFQSCAALRPYIAHIDHIYKDFTTYKIRVPVTGAIILDETFERVRDIVLSNIYIVLLMKHIPQQISNFQGC